ncbi:hypothetical protein [Clostridium paraputrificum]|uniref:hypothetical protein n=1 Tax=Clostridium paraputrificum TaxID=29363 RepID=UPI00374FAF42
MKKKALTCLSIILLCLAISNSKVKADEEIYPINNTYKPGIYILNKNDKNSYNLTYEFVNKGQKSAIIILDENYDITYKNVNCNRRCNGGTITNKNTIIVVGGEIAFYFEKNS